MSEYGTYQEFRAKGHEVCYICNKPIGKRKKYLVAWCTSIGVILHPKCKDKKSFEELDRETWAP